MSTIAHDGLPRPSDQVTLIPTVFQTPVTMPEVVLLPHAELATKLHNCLDVPAVGKCLTVYQSIEAFAADRAWDISVRSHWQSRLARDPEWQQARANYLDAVLTQNHVQQLQTFQVMVDRARAITEPALNQHLTSELYAANLGSGPYPAGDSHLPSSIVKAATTRLSKEKQFAHTWIEESMRMVAYEAAHASLPAGALSALLDGGGLLGAEEWAILGEAAFAENSVDAAKRNMDQAKAVASTEADALGYQIQTLQQQDIISSNVDVSERTKWGNDVNTLLNAVEHLEQGISSQTDSTVGIGSYHRPIGSVEQLKAVKAALYRLQLRFVVAEDMVAFGDATEQTERRVQEKVTHLLDYMKARRGQASEAEAHQLVLAAVELAQLSTSLSGRVARDYREEGQNSYSTGTLAMLHRLSRAANRLVASISVGSDVMQAPSILQESLASLHLATWVDGSRRQGRSFEGLTHLQGFEDRFGATQTYKDYLLHLAKEAPHQFDYQFPDGRSRLAVQDVSDTPIAEEAVDRIESWAQMNSRHIGRDMGVGLGSWASGALAGCTLGPKGCVVGGVVGAIAGHEATNELSIYDHKDAVTDARRSGLTDITADEAEKNRWVNTGFLAMSGVLGGFGPGRLSAVLGRWGVGAMGAGASIKAGFQTSSIDGFKILGNVTARTAYRVIPREDLFKWGLAGMGLDLFLLHENTHGHTVLSKPDYKLDTWVTWVSAGFMLVSPQVRSVLMGRGALHYAGSFLNEVRYAGTYLAGITAGAVGFFAGRTPGNAGKIAKLTMADRLKVIEEIVGDGHRLNDVDLTKLSPNEWWEIALRYRACELDAAAKVSLGTTTRDAVAGMEATSFREWFNRLPPWRKAQGETYWMDAWKGWRTVDQWKIPEVVRQAQANIRGTRSLYRFVVPLNQLSSKLGQFGGTPSRESLHGILDALERLTARTEQLFREANIAKIPERVGPARSWRFEIDRLGREIRELGHDFKSNAGQPGKLVEIQRRTAALKDKIDVLREEAQSADVSMRKTTFQSAHPDVEVPSRLGEPGFGDDEFHQTMAAQQVGYGAVTYWQPYPWVQAAFAAPNKVMNAAISPAVNFISGRVAAAKAAVAEYVPSFSKAFDQMVQDKELTRMAYVVNDNGMTTTAPAAVTALESIPRVWVDRTGQALSRIGSIFPKTEIANLHRWGTIPLAIDMVYDPKDKNVGILNPDWDVNTSWGYLGAVCLGNHAAAKLGFNNYMGSAIGTATYFFTLSGIMAQSGEEGDPNWHKHTVNFLSYQTLLLANPLFFGGVHQANKVPVVKAFMLPGLRNFPSMTAFNGMFTRTTSFLKPNLYTPSGLAYSVLIGAPLNGIGLGGLFSGTSLLDAGAYYRDQRLTKKAAAAVAIDPLQNYYGYSGVYSQLGARFVGYFVDLGLNVFTPSFHGRQLFLHKMDRLLDAKNAESLQNAWQLYVDQITSLDAGGYFAEVYVPDSMKAEGEDADVTKPFHMGWRMEPYSVDAWVEWRDGETKRKKDARGYIEKTADSTKRLGRFIDMFAQQLQDPEAKWRSSDRHGKSLLVYALTAKYYAQKCDAGNERYKPFSELVHGASLKRFWQGIPQVHTRDELNQHIEKLNQADSSWHGLLAPLWD